jgi:hypothetical protein
MIDSRDVGRWRAKLAQIEKAAQADGEIQRTWAEIDALRDEREAEGRTLLDNLREQQDMKVFRSEVDQWSRRPGPFYAFRGFG